MVFMFTRVLTSKAQLIQTTHQAVTGPQYKSSKKTKYMSQVASLIRAPKFKAFLIENILQKKKVSKRYDENSPRHSKC